MKKLQIANTVIALCLAANVVHAGDTKRLEWNDQFVSGINKEQAYTILLTTKR